MAGLQLQVLGDLEVIRDGSVLPLPPSRKTRGLLAYLALNNRPQRREQLCELLWEIPDDPRGSLRWSLSKIRKLVDDEQQPRIIADRSTVAFDTADVEIDVLDLHRATDDLAHASVDELVRLAEQNQGVFLQGLDLPDFHDYHAWCIGERERAIRSQAQVLRELGERLADQPERALDYALSLVSLTPFDESPRARLIQLLVQLDRKQEAEHQYRVGLEKLAELGVEESGRLAAALRQRSAVAPQPAPGARRPAPEHSLVGREEEVALFRGMVDSLAQADRARVVLIRGEPGIGKSRLLQAVAAMARDVGAGILKAAAFESEMIRPFGVWNDALKRALPDNATSRLLASAGEVAREQVFDSLARVLSEQTERHPVVVLCDDVHWSDESSLSALHYVLRSSPRQRLLLVATSREVELRDNNAAQQVLRSLRSDKLLDEVFLSAMPPEHIERLVKAHFPDSELATLGHDCAGNPLLALELARAGVEGGSSLAELVAERMSRFDTDAETVLHWAAVISPRLNVSVLQQVTGLPPQMIDDALAQAEQQGILHPGERGLRFAHELIRQSVYQGIPPSRCQSMHRQVAEQLERDAAVDLELAADLAHHARLSGDPFLAGKAMVSAGKLCLRFFANEDALALYREGIALAGQLNDAQRVCLTLELEEIRMTGAPVEDWQGMANEFVGLAEQAMDHGSRSHARLGYQMASYLRWLHGELSAAKRFSLQAERMSRGGTDEAQILGLAEAAKCLAMLERDLSRADAMTMEAQSLAQRTGYQSAAIPTTLGILNYYADSFDVAIEHLEDARTLAKSQGDRLTEFMANEYLAMVEMERRDCGAAQDYAAALVEIGARVREGSELPYAQCLEALCRYSLTDDDSGLAPALEALHRADAKQRLAFVLNRAAIQYIEHGELARGQACATEALELARLMERPSEVLQALLNLERIHQQDPGLVECSQREQIQQAVAAGVAGWARKRSQAVLAGP
ncbi:hypothetical protein E2F43_03945 [Seongchinamella unica]|uniref:Uncharacterized protein n=1 Tax=Seongchinamella unica TaxID=2547392 RepID=A0A4R5LVD7_9GAMM|nr:AAA family ATPase [Seongchinamella unica]TDG15393.1 hypothetical protein E2F43_03945 [Seongchinamella unica]